MTLISRDPFACTELHREKVRAPAHTCAWCGNFLTDLKGRYLYIYNTVEDGGRVHHGRGRFCSLDCYRSYNP
jgi:hypothetical protein